MGQMGQIIFGGSHACPDRSERGTALAAHGLRVLYGDQNLNTERTEGLRDLSVEALEARRSQRKLWAFDDDPTATRPCRGYQLDNRLLHLLFCPYDNQKGRSSDHRESRKAASGGHSQEGLRDPRLARGRLRRGTARPRSHCDQAEEADRL